jgi:hypothetical protein
MDINNNFLYTNAKNGIAAGISGNLEPTNNKRKSDSLGVLIRLERENREGRCDSGEMDCRQYF